VIAGVGKDLDLPLVDLAQDFDPLGQLLRAVHDGFVPILIAGMIAPDVSEYQQ